MKKYFALLLLNFLVPLAAWETLGYQECCKTYSIEGNIGYFHPFSKSLRRVISGGVNYQLLTTYKWNQNFGLFLGADYFHKNGRSTGSHSGTSLNIVPITIGIKGSIDICNFCDESGLQAYFLLGPRWYYVNSKNSPNYMPRHNYAHGFGGMGGVGIAYLYRNFLFNLVVNFSFGNVSTHTSKKHIHTPNTQVGGIFAGGGIGYSF